MPKTDSVTRWLWMAPVLFLFVYLAPAAGAEASRFIVGEVNFSGVSRIDKKALAASLVVNSPPVWKFWKKHPVASRQLLSDDVLRIEQFYRSQGYYQASAEYTLKCPEKCQETQRAPAAENTAENGAAAPGRKSLCRCEVLFQITEGKPVRLRSIDLICKNPIPTVSRSRIKAVLPFNTGDIFIAGEYERAKKVIRELLGNKGYPFARVEGDAVVRLAEHSAEVTFTVDPGKRYYFGDINISGHEGYVTQTVIERSLAFRPGKQYEARALDESRRNLFDLRVFQTAVIEPGEPDETGHTVPVNIRVQPRKQHNLRLGVGYGTEDGLRLRGAWSYRNLSGHADRFSISAKRSDLKETFQGEYFYPYFLSARNNLTVNSGYEEDKAEFYTLRKIFLTADLLHQLGNQWSAGLGYGLTGNRPESIDILEVDGDYEINENYRISNMRLELERNTVTNALNPSDGTVFRIGVEKSSQYLGSEIDYTRPGIETRAYIPLPWQLVLAGRLRMSYIEAAEDTDEIPIFKQLFLGGSKTVRGYAYQQLGVVDSDDNVLAAGGLSSLNANIELRYPIYKKFSGVAFVDMGMLDNEAFRYNFNRMRYTGGLGLRYNTIIGPIQVDLGYKFNPPDNAKSDDPEIRSLADADRWRLHINIGQAF